MSEPFCALCEGADPWNGDLPRGGCVCGPDVKLSPEAIEMLKREPVMECPDTEWLDESCASCCGTGREVIDGHEGQEIVQCRTCGGAGE